jgi:hypothetical protein
MFWARLLVACFALWITTARAQVVVERATAQEVKAAFLYNFAVFVEWPAEARARTPFAIGVSGSDEVEAELRSAVSGRKFDNRPIIVRRVETPGDVKGLHIVFLGEDQPLPRELLRAASTQHVLVVTDAPDGLEQGGAINFVTGERVQFEVSLNAAAQAGLRLSPRLLSVALRVRKGEAPPAILLAGKGLAFNL